jgi:hypothetical protein
MLLFSSFNSYVLRHTPVTQGIKNLVKGELDERDMKVFYNVQLVGFDSYSESLGSGLSLALSFQTSRPVKRWETCSSLMYGNILCLSPGGRFRQVEHFFFSYPTLFLSMWPFDERGS